MENEKIDIVEYNRKSWNKEAHKGNQWSIPVDKETIQKARNGDWNIVLTPQKFVPKTWFPSLQHKEVLCLASGGGQQAPILSAVGAIVTSFDNSDEQLHRDLTVANENNLKIKTIQGDMADLSVFSDQSFDMIFHPVSNVFVPDICLVWRECYRVLRNGGRLLAGFMNPIIFIFDQQADENGELIVKYSLPYSDLQSLEKEKLAQNMENNVPFEFSHTLETQIGGQIQAGFAIVGMYEDYWSDEATNLNKYCATSIATLATKA